MRNNDKDGFFKTFMAVSIIVWLALVGLIIYVAHHFIMKYW